MASHIELTVWMEHAGALLLNVGVATLIRIALPLAAALTASRMLVRSHPRARAGVCALGIAGTVAVSLVALVPLPAAPGALTIALGARALQTPKSASLAAASALNEPSAMSGRPRRVSAYAASTGVSPTWGPPNEGMPHRAGAPMQTGISPILPPRSPAAPAPRSMQPLFSILLLVWLVGSALLLGWAAACQFRVYRVRRGAVPAGVDLSAELRELCSDRRARVPELLLSAETAGPFVTGVWRPAVVLPAHFVTELDRQTMRAVLAHELQHITTGDVSWTMTVRALCALLWPQPLLWMVAARWREATEEACDAAALLTGCSPQRYARCLVRLAESFNRGARPVATPGMAETRSGLGRRVERILDHRFKEAPKMSLLSMRVSLAVFAGVLVLACGIVTAQQPKSERGANQAAHEAKSGAVDATAEVRATEDAGALDRRIEAVERERKRAAVTGSMEKDERKALDQADAFRAKLAAIELEQRAKTAVTARSLARSERKRSAGLSAQDERNTTPERLDHSRNLVELADAERRAAEADTNRARRMELLQRTDRDAARADLDRAKRELDATSAQRRSAELNARSAARSRKSEFGNTPSEQTDREAKRAAEQQETQRATSARAQDSAAKRAAEQQEAQRADEASAQERAKKRSAEQQDAERGAKASAEQRAKKRAAEQQALRAEDASAQERAAKRAAEQHDAVNSIKARAQDRQAKQAAEKRAAEDFERANAMNQRARQQAGGRSEAASQLVIEAHRIELDALSRELAAREAKLIELHEVYTEGSPAIAEARATVEALRKRLDTLGQAMSVTGQIRSGARSSTDEASARQARIDRDRLEQMEANLHSTIDAMQRERKQMLADRGKQAAETRMLRKELADLQMQLDLLRRQQQNRNERKAK